MPPNPSDGCAPARPSVWDNCIPSTRRHLSRLRLFSRPRLWEALRRISTETAYRGSGGACAAFPPRTPAGEPRGEGDNEILDYLTGFFRTFFHEELRELPADYCPITSAEIPALETKILFCGKEVWSGFEDAIRKNDSSVRPSKVQHFLYQLVSQPEDVCQALAAVDSQRCVDCGAADEEGTEDPLDGRWRCRFCWELMLLDSALRDPGCIPLPFHELELLRDELGEFFIPGDRQRWRWEEGADNKSWVEFRPKGVLWHSRSQVGFWEQWTETDRDRQKRQKLAIHLVKRFDGKRFPEARYLLQLGQQRDGSAHLEEYQRDSFRPLGFVAEARRYTFKERPRVLLRPPRGFQPTSRAPAQEVKFPTNGNCKPPKPEPVEPQLEEHLVEVKNPYFVPAAAPNGTAQATMELSCADPATKTAVNGQREEDTAMGPAIKEAPKPQSTETTARGKLAYALGR